MHVKHRQIQNPGTTAISIYALYYYRYYYYYSFDNDRQLLLIRLEEKKKQSVVQYSRLSRRKATQLASASDKQTFQSG